MSAEAEITIQGWAAKLKIDAGLLQKKITFDLYADIVKFTPVDTGRARANWFVSVGAPSSEVHELPDAVSNSVPPPTPASIEIDGTQDTYIINNLDYIQYLDEGSSSQAPVGMVQLAIDAQKSRLAAAVASLKE